MRILKRNQTLLNGQNQVTFEIPNTTVALGALILTIVQALATALGTYLINLPQQKANLAANKLKEKNIEIQLLQRVLENEDSVARVNSLKLIIAANLIDDPDGRIASLFTNPANIPKWPKHPLENFNGTFEMTSPPSTVPPGTVPPGTTQIGSSPIKKP